MKIWSKIKYPLYLTLIVLLMTFLRFGAMAVPSWIPTMLLSPLIASRLILGDSLTNVLLAAVSIGAVMLVPCEVQWGQVQRSRLRRFLLRPALAVLVIFGLSAILIAANDQWEDMIWDRTVAASHREIREFIDIADEAIVYSNSEYQGSNYQQDFPELVMEGRYVTDTMMIDYDSMTIGFCYHHIAKFELKTFSFKSGGNIPGNYEWSHSVALSEPGALLTFYFDYRDGQEGNGSTTTCIALTMADGTVYTAANLTDPRTGYSYFVGHLGGGAYEPIENFQERKQYD